MADGEEEGLENRGREETRERTRGNKDKRGQRKRGKKDEAKI